MVYVIAGLVSSAFMLLYRRPPGRKSPLLGLSWTSPVLERRLSRNGDRVASTVGLVGSFSILVIIAASRYGIGTDYWARLVPVFEHIRLGNEVDYEPGFVAINRAVGFFTADPQWLVAVLSFLTIALVFRFIVRMSLDPALSVFVFVFGGFYLEVFNLAQQGLAIAILLNTIELALRRRHLALILCTVLAASIHSSALIWFLVWPLLFIRFGRFWRVVVILAAALAIVALPQVIIDVVQSAAPEYAWYAASDYGTARTVTLGVVFASFGLCALSVVLIRSGERGDHYSDAIVNLLVIGLLLLLATITVAYFFSRLVYYFSPIQMLALPLLLASIRGGPARATVRILFLAVYAVSFTFQFLVWNAHGVLPYDSVFAH